jgi:hypothetical protein
MGHLITGPDSSRYVMGPRRLVRLDRGVAYLSRAEALLDIREQLVIPAERNGNARAMKPSFSTCIERLARHTTRPKRGGLLMGSHPPTVEILRIDYTKVGVAEQGDAAEPEA